MSESTEAANPGGEGEHFYRDLTPFRRFVEGVFSPERYQPLPDDWYLVIADISGSTRAVENGRYAEVNYLGAACVVAVNNALEGRVVPSSFGGDGATLAVPHEALHGTVKALLATRRWGREAFGLDLRVGSVPVAVLSEMGEPAEVAKLEFSPGNVLAMFRGNGFDVADRLIKDDPGTEGYRIAESGDEESAPDLADLSCRWAPLESENGTMLCLIIAARADTLARSDAIYRESLSRIDAIAPLESAATSPVKLSNLKRRIIPAAMAKEVTHEDGPPWKRWPVVIARHLIQHLVFWLGLKPGEFDPEEYKRETAINSDFRRVAGMLRLILDCTVEQADRIEATLSELSEAGDVFFGAHRADQAIMTCVTPNVDNHEHVHYIDGGEGGLYSAAKHLKAQMAGAKCV